MNKGPNDGKNLFYFLSNKSKKKKDKPKKLKKREFPNGVEA